MTVARKPKPQKQPTEAEALALINKGGSVATIETQEPKLASVLLRVPTDMLQVIDAAVKKRRPVRISRQSWILETLYERLKQEKEI